jgi:DNA-binding NarL/FixJ family response regulator
MPPYVVALSQREIDVLALVAEGYGNKEIAETLSISVNTVKDRLGSVYDKLRAEDRTQAVIRAIRLGFLPLTPITPKDNNKEQPFGCIASTSIGGY